MVEVDFEKAVESMETVVFGSDHVLLLVTAQKWVADIAVGAVVIESFVVLDVDDVVVVVVVVDDVVVVVLVAEAMFDIEMGVAVVAVVAKYGLHIEIVAVEFAGVGLAVAWNIVLAFASFVGS